MCLPRPASEVMLSHASNTTESPGPWSHYW